MRCDKNTPVGAKVKLVDGPFRKKYSSRIKLVTTGKPEWVNNEWQIWISGNGISCPFPVKYLEVVDEKGD
jgi:hypothetical protein